MFRLETPGGIILSSGSSLTQGARHGTSQGEPMVLSAEPLRTEISFTYIKKYCEERAAYRNKRLLPGTNRVVGRFRCLSRLDERRGLIPVAVLRWKLCFTQFFRRVKAIKLPWVCMLKRTDSFGGRRYRVFFSFCLSLKP